MTEYCRVALDLSNHPLKQYKKKTKAFYLKCLEFFLRDFVEEDYINQRLDSYKKALLNCEDVNELDNVNMKKALSYILSTKYFPWREKYKYFLFCDVALILLDHQTVKQFFCCLNTYLDEKRFQRALELLSALIEGKYGDNKYIRKSEYLIEQFRKNHSFLQKDEKKIVFTATMSAGKSTLINALIGKKLARTSVEACTGNLSYFKNKAFEDDFTCINHEKSILNASELELSKFDWATSPEIISHFNNVEGEIEKVCLIDTPGVNSAINKEHKVISRDLIASNDYDKLIYIFNANKLGTDEELSYLKWISETVERDKIVFVLNKLDTYRAEDNIDQTIESLLLDLEKHGYDSPILCPLSAQVGLLDKMKRFGITLSEDDEDEYFFQTKRFSRGNYNFTKYYSGLEGDEDLLNQCGLNGLEKVLYA